MPTLDAELVPQVDPPAPPAPLSRPCPAGWQQVPVGSSHGCTPYPAGTPDTCPVGEAHFPGEAGCTPFGRPCPSGRFPRAGSLASDQRLWFVAPGAVGDGSRDRPFGDIAKALARATAGDTVVVGRGEYHGRFVLPDGVDITGSCIAETTIDGGDRHAIQTGRGSTVGDLHVVGAIQLGPESVVHDVLVTEGAVTVSGPVVANNLVVLGARNDRRGLANFTRSSIDLTRVMLSGMLSTMGPTIVRDSAVWNQGVSVSRGASLHAERLAVMGGTSGVIFADEDSGATIEDLALHDVGEFGLLAVGLHQIALKGVSIFGLAHHGLVASEGAVLQAEDAALLGRRDPDSTAPASGITAVAGATTHVERLHAANLRGSVLLAQLGAILTATDVTVEDVQVPVGGRGLGLGRSAEANTGGALSLERARLANAGDPALIAMGDGSRLLLRDATVGWSADVTPTNAAAAQSEATFAATRLRIDQPGDVGLIAMLSAAMVLEHVVVTGTTTTMELGHGIGSYVGSQVSVDHFQSGQHATCGAHVVDATLTMTDGLIHDNPIGVCDETARLDPETSFATVRFRGNDFNLDATNLPVPTPATALPSI